MTDQDQVNERNVCLIIKGGRLTGRTLALAMRMFLAAGKKVTHHEPKRGKQSLKELSSDGSAKENIPISGDAIRAFERVAAKYEIDYAVRKDVSEDPPKYLVFFKSKDAKDMAAAFREFSAKQLCKSAQKPSILQTLQKMMAKVQNQPEQTQERSQEAAR